MASNRSTTAAPVRKVSASTGGHDAVAGTHLYPIPGLVSRYRGRPGSGSSVRRSGAK